MAGNHAVLLGRDVDPPDLSDTTRLALFDQGIKHRKFQFAVHYAAAHEPKIQLYGKVADTTDEHGHETIVAKSVSQSAVQSNKSAIPRNGLDFRDRIPSGRKIKLIGLVDQLRNPLR